MTIPLEWLKGGQVSNPVMWNDSKTSDYENHKGLYFINGKVYKNSVKIEYTNHAIFLKMPRVNLFKTILFSFLKDYHKGDINLPLRNCRECPASGVNTARKWSSLQALFP